MYKASKEFWAKESLVIGGSILYPRGSRECDVTLLYVVPELICRQLLRNRE